MSIAVFSFERFYRRFLIVIYLLRVLFVSQVSMLLFQNIFFLFLYFFLDVIERVVFISRTI